MDASRSASGANSRAFRVNSPSPSEVDPDERVPGVLAEVDLVEALRLELADQQVAVDRLVGAEAVHRRELGQPAVPEGQPLGTTGRREVGPAVVVGVLADRRSRRSDAARKYSSRKASTRVEKSDIGQV